MNERVVMAPLLAILLAISAGCDSKKDPVATGREAVKDVVTQPFNTLDAAKESLSKSAERSKAAIEELEKEFKQP
jgi:predicted outer membrane protein